MWGLMFFAFSAASSTTYQKVHSIGASMIASVWSALVSTLATVLFAVLIGSVFITRMQMVLSAEFTTSGMRDSQAFVIRNMFDGALSHLLLAPLVAVAVGAASALLRSRLSPFARRTLVILGSMDLVLLVAGLYSIGLASSLIRSARPPFIMLGLGALCLSLTSAHPIASTLRLRHHGSGSI